MKNITNNTSRISCPKGAFQTKKCPLGIYCRPVCAMRIFGQRRLVSRLALPLRGKRTKGISSSTFRCSMRYVSRREKAYQYMPKGQRTRFAIYAPLRASLSESGHILHQPWLSALWAPFGATKKQPPEGGISEANGYICICSKGQYKPHSALPNRATPRRGGAYIEVGALHQSKGAIYAPFGFAE